MRDAYEVIGLDKSAGKDALTERYNELKNKYGEDRFLSGEAGNDAAVKLMELENAWLTIRADIEKESSGAGHYEDSYAYIDNLIKQGKYTEAQAELDSITESTAQGHYLQSILYYKRDWISESKAQLELAIGLDPYNERYKQALEKMKMINGNNQVPPQAIGGTQYSGQTQQQPTQQQNMCSTCNSCCMAYLCTDCCCSLMQCCG